MVTFLEDAYQTREELEAMERRSRQVLRSISRANGAKYTFDDIVAVTPAAAQVKALAEKIAATDATVLLESESGTGKELYAQAIHNHSPRREVFVAINCRTSTPTCSNSELFGLCGGPLPGPKGKSALFEAAAETVGGVKELDTDVRVIAACNANLPDYVAQGRFRKDLYYRLNTFPVHIPPLRERPGDIPALAGAILDDLSRKLHRSFSLTGDAVSRLQAHDWPGNVRELRNVLEFSAYLSSSGIITEESLPDSLPHDPQSAPLLTLAQRTRAFEKREISRLLEQNGSSLEGKKKTAAITLGRIR